MSAAQPGWYADPTQQAEYRYFDGANWTDQVQSGTPVSPAPSLPLSAPAVTGAWWEQSASVSQPATTEAGQSFHDQNTVSIAARSASSQGVPLQQSVPVQQGVPVQSATPPPGNFPHYPQTSVPPQQQAGAVSAPSMRGSSYKISPVRQVVIVSGVLLQFAVISPWIILHTLGERIDTGNPWQSAPLLTYDLLQTDVPIGLIILAFFILASAVSSVMFMVARAHPADQIAIICSIFVLLICAAYVVRIATLFTGLEGFTELFPGPGLVLPVIGSLLVIGGCLGALVPSKSD